jgi:hypothetical protein
MIDASGVSAVPILQGLGLFSPGTIIGGTTAARNIISGNAENGVYIRATTRASGWGNFISTDKNRTSAIGNHGVLSVSVNALTGSTTGTTSGPCGGACNLISGNLNGGLTLANHGFGASQVQGNFIGTDVTGTWGYPMLAVFIGPTTAPPSGALLPPGTSSRVTPVMV